MTTLYIAKISSFGTFPGGGWGESKIQLISAKAEAEAWAELGNKILNYAVSLL